MNMSNTTLAYLLGIFIANMVHFTVGFSLEIYERSALTRAATIPPSLTEINEEYNSCMKDNSKIKYCNDIFQANISLHNKIIENKGN